MVNNYEELKCDLCEKAFKGRKSDGGGGNLCPNCIDADALPIFNEGDSVPDEVTEEIAGGRDNDASAPVQPLTGVFTPYLIKINTAALNVRKGPGTNHAVVKTLMNDKNIYTIVKEAEGPGAKKWGKLKSGAGWISLDYTLKK